MPPRILGEISQMEYNINIEIEPREDIGLDKNGVFYKILRINTRLE